MSSSSPYHFRNGSGFWFWLSNLKGETAGSFWERCLKPKKGEREVVLCSWPSVSSERGACSWGALIAGLGRKPLLRTSLPAAALLTWKINFLLSRACVSWRFVICSPGNIKTDTFISWCNFEYLFQCYIHLCLMYLIINLIWKPSLWLWIDLICIHFSCLIFVYISLNSYETWIYHYSPKNTHSWIKWIWLTKYFGKRQG